MKSIKSIATFILSLLPANLRNEIIFKKDMLLKNDVLNNWEKAGRPVPPPHIIKQQIVKSYRDKYKYKILVETGTYLGHMLETQRSNFDKLYSIELSEKFYGYNVKKFRQHSNVTIIEGDSAKMLPILLTEIDQPVIFWLDGHYSLGTAKGDRECPVYDELNAIFNSKVKQHVVLIDDARDFIGKNDYPTISELKEFVQSKNVYHTFEVENDVIRITIGGH